jgi:predicted transcriptional regulator
MAGRTSTEEVVRDENRYVMKTLAIKLEDDTHSQLVVLAQLDGLTLADVLHLAVEQYVERKRSEGDLEARAASVLEEIEREATARREAIQALFAPSEVKAEAATPAEPTVPEPIKPTRSRKTTGEASA